MLKKTLAVLVLGVLVSGSAYTQFSIGFGGTFTSAFDGGYEVSYMGIKAGLEVPYKGGGFYTFFDAKYAEASLGLFFGTIEMKPTGVSAVLGDGISINIDVTSLNIGFLGKFPFNLGPVTIFPAVGIEYNPVLAVKYEIPEMDQLLDADDFSNFWIKFGGGLDVALLEKLYLRGTILYGIRLMTKFEENMIDLLSSVGGGISPEYVLGHGIQVKLALGYKF